MPATAERKPEANSIFQQAVATTLQENGELGMQVAVYLDGEQVVDVWGGIADETTGRAVDGDTLFPSFSVIKATTATALHLQAERGLIEYDTPIAHYWPEFAAHGKDTATVRDALSHRLGIPYMPEGVTPELMSNYDWMVDQLANMKPDLYGRHAECLYVLHLRLGHCRVRAPDRSQTAALQHVRTGRDLCAPWHDESLDRDS